MADTISTIQTSIHQHENDKLEKYALFLGGLNVTHEVLANYDPLRTGYGRLFMVRKPAFVVDNIADKFQKFKHILEYGNTSIQGISDITQETNSITGGYAGKSFDIPSFASDGTNGFQVQVYEFSGSPVREVIHTWINGMNDLLTGLTHYNGSDTPVSQANQTAEFIYVATDNTGTQVEYACMFANCFPKGIKNDHFNYNSGEHNLVDYTIDFAGTKYESIQINSVAKALLAKYKLLSNSLNFYSGIKTDTSGTELGGRNPFKYNIQTGELTDVGTVNENDWKELNTPIQETDVAKINAKKTTT